MISPKQSVAVIGAGIIGVTSAAYLVRDGYDVTMIDPEGIGESTSSGNAGTFAYFDVYPLPEPSILLQAPKWFFDPLGPLAIPLPYVPKLLPWLTGFLWACRPVQVSKSVELMKQLMPLSRDQAHQFWQDWDLSEYIIQRSALSVHESEAAFRQAKIKWQESARHGVEIEYLQGQQIQDMEPAIDKRFKYAALVKDSPMVTDPKIYTKAIGKRVLGAGAQLIKQKISQIHLEGNMVALTDQTGNKRLFDKVVIAMGSWSKQLANQLGDKLPLDAERGYNTTIPAPNIKLSHFVLFPDHGFVASPLSTGLRIGGANELAGTDYPPNYKRAEHLLNKAKKFLPGLKSDGGTQWMGRRPSLADTQPLIDYSSASRNVVYAFGHGHYGLTQSAATGKLVSELIGEKTLSINHDGLKLKRFK